MTSVTMDKIKKSTIRANTIIIDLLKYSGSSPVELKPVAISEAIDEAVDLVGNQARMARVVMERNYASESPQVTGDENMLQQVFFNLFTNAIDAMPEGGKILVSIPPYKRVNGTVTIEVEDTGQGIPESIIGSIFEPFFTTKRPRKGTGLGLSVCHTILERHNGTICAESELDKGTRFIITLPVSGPAECRKESAS